MTNDPLTAIFMAKGMCEHHSAELAYDIMLEDRGVGQVELFQQAADLMTYITQAKCIYEEGGHPGVFVYDVAEPLGHYIIDHIIQHADVPTIDAIVETAIVYANQAIPEDI